MPHHQQAVQRIIRDTTPGQISFIETRKNVAALKRRSIEGRRSDGGTSTLYGRNSNAQRRELLTQECAWNRKP